MRTVIDSQRPIIKNRIESLDYLRGLAALSILSFHFSTWIFGELDPQTFFGKMGVYGVSIFYILSGLTLYYVYHDKIYGKLNIAIFILKRIFRIYPLLFLVTSLNLLFGSSHKSLWLYLKNITGLFGFIDPSGYIATGAWSIGNELVFYAFFPLVLILSKGKKYFFNLSLFLMVVVALYFCFFYIDKNSTIILEWKKYVNPFNQIFLFFSGVFIGMNRKLQLKNSYNLSLIVLFLFLLWIYPIQYDIELITGMGRIILSIFMFLICTLFYWTELDINIVVKKILIFFGDISYSIYLIHPITFAFLMKFSGLNTNPYIFLVLNILLAILVSSISYFFIEKTFVKLGNKIVKRLKPAK